MIKKGSHGFEADRGHTAIAEAEGIGRGFRKVDDALAVERPAIIDDHFNRLARVLVGDLNLGAEGERTMRRRHGVFVEDFSRCCPLAVKAGAIPGSATTLGVSCRRGNCEDGRRCGDENGSSDQWSMLTEVVDEHCLKMSGGVIKGGIVRDCGVLPHCRSLASVLH